MQDAQFYDPTFFDSMEQGSFRSATEVFRIWPYPVPTRVIDYGGGRGCWAYAARKRYACETLCIDGDYVTQPYVEFEAHDVTKPYITKTKYDLAICLEVIEHIDKAYEGTVIETLTKLSKNILFSGATPGQGGTNHVNEQPEEHWFDMFRLRGYAIDTRIRNLIDPNQMEWWYAKNIFYAYKTVKD